MVFTQQQGGSNQLINAERASYLQRCLSQMQLSITSEVQAKLLAYIILLLKWNLVYNLTAICEPKRIISHHLMDSLAILPYLPGRQLLDVGSGAGLPGIPLALVNPDKQFVLLDSNGKKARFLLHAVSELNMTNVQIINHRVETYDPGYRFDGILVRAVGSIAMILKLTQHLCGQHGLFLIMKGNYPAIELAELTSPFKVVAIHTLNVPGVDGQRTLISVGRS